MSASEQVKINKNLHEKVKEFVDNESTYSSYKSFYEEAVRRHLRLEKGEISDKERAAIKEIAEKELD